MSTRLRMTQRGGRMKSIRASLEVHRTGSRNLPFHACLYVGGKNSAGGNVGCSYGRNPRAAIAKAAAALSKSIRRRRGTFKGFGRGRR